MVSEVQICNNMLLKIGAETITSLTQLNSKEATACSIMYPQMRDDVLTAHPWNFAISQEQLQVSSDVPLFEFAYQYLLPVHCLRVLRAADGSGNSLVHVIKGRYLHTDSVGVYIEFIKQITDPTLFSSQFIDVLATRMGAELAYPIAGSSERGTALMEQYKIKLKEAKTRDGQEGTPKRIQAESWLNSRR